MEFLKGVPVDPSSGVKAYCCNSLGLLIPDISALDLLSGMDDLRQTVKKIVNLST
jgi:glutaredoxin-related protein